MSKKKHKNRPNNPNKPQAPLHNNDTARPEEEAAPQYVLGVPEEDDVAPVEQAQAEAEIPTDEGEVIDAEAVAPAQEESDSIATEAVAPSEAADEMPQEGAEDVPSEDEEPWIGARQAQTESLVDMLASEPDVLGDSDDTTEEIPTAEETADNEDEGAEPVVISAETVDAEAPQQVDEPIAQEEDVVTEAVDGAESETEDSTAEQPDDGSDDASGHGTDGTSDDGADADDEQNTEENTSDEGGNNPDEGSDESPDEPSETSDDDNTDDGAGEKPDGEEISEEERKRREEAAQKKAERKAKTKAWFKKHMLLVILLCVGVVLAAGLVTGHFVTTMRVAFIHNSDDLAKAVADGKKTQYIFKSDIDYEGALSIGEVDIDMNKYTLRVNGGLTMIGDGFVGYKKIFWSKPQVGGAVVVTGDVMLEGNRAWYSDLTVHGAVTATGTLDVAGTLSADNVHAEGDLNVSGTVQAPVELAQNATIEGAVSTINGGQTVTVKGSAELIAGAEKLYLYPDSNVKAFDVNHYYFVQYLEVPTVLVKEVDGTQQLMISQVPNADGYTVSIEGKDDIDVRKTNTAYTTCELPELDPGNYTMYVKPYSDAPDVYIAGASTKIKVSYYVQLQTPEVQIDKSVADGVTQVIMTIGHVDNADSFVVHVAGKDYKINAESDTTSFEITKYVGDVGKYDIYVHAVPAKKSNYKESAKTMVTFQQKQEATATVTARFTNDGAVAVINGNGNAYYYRVDWKKGGVVVTTSFVKAEEGDTVVHAALQSTEADTVTVTLLTKGYYEAGEAQSTAILGE